MGGHMHLLLGYLTLDLAPKHASRNYNEFLHAVAIRAEVPDLCTKDKVTQLSIGKEDDEEHDRKTGNILCTLQEENYLN